MKYTTIILLFIGGFLSSCNNWLNLAPENERLSGDYWTSKDDVKNTMMSCYSRMRECQNLMLEWGELRGDVLILSGGEEHLLKMHEQNITSENILTKWNSFYKVINAANSVIQYAPSVLGKDALFTEEELDHYLAEAKVVRSLMYFYLVKTFREVPLITDAYLTDAQELKQPKVPSEKVIINQIILDLQWSLKRLNVSYGGDGYWENKSRVTRWAAQTLFADVLLWDEQYGSCLEACELIINSERYRLIGDVKEEEEEEGEGETIEEEWFDIFYPGMSEESIWELYYDHEDGQTNQLYTKFNELYKLRGVIVTDFNSSENIGDIRGANNSFLEGDDNKIWKFLGIKNDGKTARTNKNLSPNWIFYRYSEVHLMYAEACVMFSVGSEYCLKAMEAINIVRKRARGNLLDKDDALTMSKMDWVKLILEERKKEFIGEGKRWYDLVRVAKKDMYTTYKQMIIDVLLENVPMAEKAIYQTKLSNPYSLYLPIYQEEIEMGRGVLIQNPAYQ